MKRITYKASSISYKTEGTCRTEIRNMKYAILKPEVSNG